MRSLVVRYRAFLLVSVVLLGLSLLDRELGQQVYDTTAYQLREMILVIPPIFILLGLLDIWVPKQTMVRFMGEGSGLKGVLLALFIGSAAAGPLYGAFPVAAVFMKKGVKLSNILIFLGAWSTTKIPMLLFEFTALGVPFALTRLLVNLPGIIIIAAILEKLMSQKEKDSLYERAQSL
ncbi:MAG: permease [Sphaerochaeta sp.]|uniref:permease n=1 Tax=Sphaerochaeta sp. TaxID=1972642 RepID=UPI001D7C7419|nr:permease [uncultured Sphaerochaeta sp.]MDD3057734.1 permease [Sphaerochaeta sp.]MDD3928410.1 permease [Sphaerochaeta sp.]NCC12311.1 permease [Spirochaetia bacterium]NCC88748.1 permease [Spirochaetia bacterium]